MPQYLLITYFVLLALLTGCSADEPRDGSLPITIHEPREVASVAENPDGALTAATELATQVTGYLTNILAKYEIAADRYEVAVDGDAVQDERARLRELTNAWFARATRDGLDLPTRPNATVYRTTEALTKVPADDFNAAFTDAVAREKRDLLDVLDRYEATPLPPAYRQLVDALRDRL